MYIEEEKKKRKKKKVRKKKEEKKRKGRPVLIPRGVRRLAGLSKRNRSCSRTLTTPTASNANNVVPK